MWQQEFIWFFAIFHQEFRKNNPIAFEVLMVLAVANLFGFYNPKQLADFLGVPHQKFYAELKDWSVYHVKKCSFVLWSSKLPRSLGLLCARVTPLNQERV
jgi:hypothetical protein